MVRKSEVILGTQKHPAPATGIGCGHLGISEADKNATHSLARPAATTKRERGVFIEYVGTALQSRPARAIIALKIRTGLERTGLETRPHMFY